MFLKSNSENADQTKQTAAVDTQAAATDWRNAAGATSARPLQVLSL